MRSNKKEKIINICTTNPCYNFPIFTGVANNSLNDTDCKFSGKFTYINHSDDSMNIVSSYIEKVIYSDPATIVFWNDGTKTVSKCNDDIYSPETGLAICVLKKLAGATHVYNLFNDWLPVTGNTVTLKNVRAKNKKNK